MTVQKLHPLVDTEILAAKRYYEIISSLNQLNLSGIELNLLAFMAAKGSISNTNNRDVFCETFKSSKSTIYNTLHKLSRKNLIHKVDGKIKIIPAISLDFKNPVVLNITIYAETFKEKSKGLSSGENL